MSFSADSLSGWKLNKNDPYVTFETLATFSPARKHLCVLPCPILFFCKYTFELPVEEKKQREQNTIRTFDLWMIMNMGSFCLFNRLEKVLCYRHLPRILSSLMSYHLSNNFPLVTAAKSTMQVNLSIQEYMCAIRC